MKSSSDDMAQEQQGLNASRVPLMLICVLGLVRVLLNLLDVRWAGQLSWSPLRLFQHLVSDNYTFTVIAESDDSTISLDADAPSVNVLFRPTGPGPNWQEVEYMWKPVDANGFSILGGLWRLNDISNLFYPLVAILALFRRIPFKRVPQVLAAITLVAIGISVFRLFGLNIGQYLSLREELLLNLSVGLNTWLLFGAFSVWIYFASQSTPTATRILMQTLQQSPSPQEGQQPVEPPYNQPPQGSATGPQGFGSTPAFGVIDPNKPQFRLQMFGAGDRLFTLMELRALADTKSLQPSTVVLQDGVGFAMPASTIPGVFSKKTWLVALLLALFVGPLGIDRFYLGHTGIGIAKLLTFGGCGVWALIDLVLIAMRKVKDSEGLQLS